MGGFHTEYSSLKFAMFFLAEYINMVTVSAVATTLFLGGWLAPWPISLIPGANEGWWPMLWWLGKVMCFIFLYIWLRGTLPRFRYDQFMAFGWKVLIPVSLVWIVLVSIVRVVRDEYELDLDGIVVGGSVLVVAMLVMIASIWVRGSRVIDEKEPLPESISDLDDGAFPVPPMPGQTFEYTPRVRKPVPATAGGSSDKPVEAGDDSKDAEVSDA